ncbi:hypothetical protein ACEPPN_011022 [Leptodophora sp. 'Broadleaf-Isolate-01']
MCLVSQSKDSDINQRWVVHQLDNDGSQFTISSEYTASFQVGKGYALQKENGKFVTVNGKGSVQISGAASYFQAFSVTYSS